MSTETLSDARQLLARGTSIQLADDASLEIVFTTRVMATLEERYGSLETYFARIDGGLNGPLICTVAETISVVADIPQEQALDLIDTRRLHEYLPAIRAAIYEALPQLEAKAQGNAESAPGASPGADSSMSRLSNGTSRRRRSGA